MQFQSSHTADPMMIYLHMQKCGGTSLRMVVEKNYENPLHLNEWRHKSGWKIMESFNEFGMLNKWRRRKKLEEHDVLMGHFPYGIHEILKQPCTYITMVREPLDRVYSLYAYWYHSNLSKYIGEDLREFLTTNRYGAVLKDNHMVRVFNSTEGFLVPYGQLTEAHLNTAITNMRKCDFVGLTEQFNLSLHCMAERYGWNDVSFVPQNVNGNRKVKDVYAEIPKDVQRDIAPRIELDLELYDAAKEYFTECTACSSVNAPVCQ